MAAALVTALLFGVFRWASLGLVYSAGLSSINRSVTWFTTPDCAIFASIVALCTFFATKNHDGLAGVWRTGRNVLLSAGVVLLLLGLMERPDRFLLGELEAIATAFDLAAHALVAAAIAIPGVGALSKRLAR